ncbi:uncharacterized protein LOC106008481 isoform X8 [Heterocephalus glaber]|uniref:Uncharacterized protein LOC106008481 isoform X8 n=1 Tax=Heterocephalus glaber TaxID=10181 RepID=A0AAX6SC55_HETGA|nr:uncharacterized protein LOC106008481 isoform X8 [Heterocephalus glaber]
MMAAGSTANCLALGSDIAPAWSPVSPQCVRGRRGTRRLLTGRKKVWKSIVLQIGTQIGKKTRTLNTELHALQACASLLNCDLRQYPGYLAQAA